MKTSWEVKKLGEVCEVIAGQSPEGKYYNNLGEGLPFYQGKKEFTDKYLGEPTTWTTNVTKEAQKDDVLMSVRAPVGPINFSTQKICIGRGLAAIRASKMIDKDFLFNFLLKHENELVGNAGAVFNSINKTQIENIKIPVPPLPEQKHIVAILDEAFESITKAKENAEKNLNNAKEIFESYLQSVFENKGEGWEEKKLQELSVNYKKDIVDGPFGSDLKRSHFITSGIPVLKLQNVKEGRLELKNMDYVCLEKASSLKRHAFHSGDIVMTKLGAPLGVSAIVKNISEGIIVADLVRIRAQKINTEYLCYFLNSRKIRDFINSKQKGTTRPRIRLSVVRELPIAFPNTDKGQELMVKKLESLSQETKKLEAVYEKKLADLEELKKSILAKAFAGKLTEASA